MITRDNVVVVPVWRLLFSSDNKKRRCISTVPHRITLYVIFCYRGTRARYHVLSVRVLSPSVRLPRILIGRDMDSSAL